MHEVLLILLACLPPFDSYVMGEGVVDRTDSLESERFREGFPLPLRSNQVHQTFSYFESSFFLIDRPTCPRLVLLSTTWLDMPISAVGANERY
jgi:hypothetical protein